MKLQPGDIVPIRAETTTGLFPRAYVYDKDDALLDTIDLTEVSDGLYSYDNSFLMPDDEFIVVKYKAFTDGTYATEAGVERDLEVFIRDQGGSGGSATLIPQLIHAEVVNTQEVLAEVVNTQTIMADVDQ